ncbi:hypothetical protein AAXE64_27245 [Priestia megaterium]
MKKRASGTVLHNSSPQAIEQTLENEIKDALGDFQSAVQTKVFLEIQDEDNDLSTNVTNAYGAIRLTVYGANLYIPFLIVDKTLLPFDVIRMGDEEVAYDYSKLRKIVNSIEHKAKSAQEGVDNGDGFDTMEVAQFDDIQPNNGFLGTIMAVRDNHRQKDLRGDTPWDGPGFGTMDDERLLRMAQVDVFNEFHETMEKIAQVKVYTPAQLESFEQHITKQAQEELEAEFEKTAAVHSDENTLEIAKLKNDMIKLSDAKLFNVHRAASGNNIMFPTFTEGSFTFNLGRVYRKFDGWVQNSTRYTSPKLDAMVIDKDGGFVTLESNQPFMASTEKPMSFDLPSTEARALKEQYIYTTEKGIETLMNPFRVEHSYNEGQRSEMMVINRNKKSNVMGNPLFEDYFHCREVNPGKFKDGNDFGDRNQAFGILVSKHPSIQEPTWMSFKEVKEYINQYVEELDNVKLTVDMVSSGSYDFFRSEDEKVFILFPEDHPFFRLERHITNYYTRPDSLFKEGPLSKQAAYNDQNKATLVVLSDRQPKKYRVEWQFTEHGKGSESQGVKLEKRSQGDLSEGEAKTLLNKLGFDFRKQTLFFEITKRNGRSATFNLPKDHNGATTALTDQTNSKVKQKMKGIADAMLHSKNFMPAFEDSVSSGIANVLASTIPSSVSAAQRADNFFSLSKESEEVATEMEKTASKLNGKTWHEISAMINLKHRLDKVAGEIYQGNYVHNGHDVFEKVAGLKEVIEKQASELIDFNRKQRIRTNSYLVNPTLIKSAVAQLDGLYRYASFVKKNELTKQAGIFRTNPLLKQGEQYIGNAEKNVQRLQQIYENANAKLRAVMHEGSESPNVQQALQNAKQAEAELTKGVQELRRLHESQGDVRQKEAVKNVGAATAVGVPGLAGLAYARESAHDSQ